MRLSENIFYRKMYFSFPIREVPVLREVYAFLIKGKRNIMVDCGVSYNYPDIVALAAEAEINLSDIDSIILTHCHSDHTGGLFRLKSENKNIKVFSHIEGKRFIEDINSQFKERPVPAFYFINGGSVRVDETFSDDDELDNGYEIKIMHTPGHSADSISLWLPEKRVLISGDAIPYVNDVPIYEDLAATLNSLGEMRMLRPFFVLSAFSGPWDISEKGDIFDVTKNYITQVSAAIDSSLKEHPDDSLEEVGKSVMKKLGFDGPPMPIFLRSIKAHIENNSK